MSVFVKICEIILSMKTDIVMLSEQLPVNYTKLRKERHGSIFVIDWSLNASKTDITFYPVLPCPVLLYSSIHNIKCTSPISLHWLIFILLRLACNSDWYILLHLNVRFDSPLTLPYLASLHLTPQRIALWRVGRTSQQLNRHTRPQEQLAGICW